VYGPSLALARAEMARWGITHRLYDAMDVDAAVALMGPRTKLMWLEAPGSVTMEFPPVAALAAAARERGICVALDDTWGTGIAFKPFELGVDIAMQALTKYPSGGGDVLMGSVVTRDDALHERIKTTHMHLGLGVAGNDAEAVLRALPSLALRYAAQAGAGLTLAQWLATRAEVARVLHPALPGAPGHDNWRQHCSTAAGLFSVMLDERYSPAQVDGFVDALKLFRIGYSWAGPVSLVVPYNLAQMRDARSRAQPHLKGHLVRLSIGLEAVDDLRADVAQALASLG
jgi:cysteine-S-conjugate beta-lyase